MLEMASTNGWGARYAGFGKGCNLGAGSNGYKFSKY
jgi:hypothetical protein